MEGVSTPEESRSTQATTWSKDRVAAMLAADDFTYQRIELPHGLCTAGRHDRSATARRIFPDDLRGTSVLDVGCRLGYFCFEAIKRGAGPVTGIDVDPESVRKARLLADCLGCEVRFEVRDVERAPITEPVDDVLCLNLLHHLANPIGTLEQLAAVARRRLVLEVAALRRTDRSKAGVPRLLSRLLERLPVIVVSPAAGGDASAQKFFVTAAALDNLLRHPRFGFARVELLPSRHKGRFIAIAHKP
jgi:2-polyprenyl-3-methyl-5-hydroxy-6-metoxy-1,4-benzoquinol methylase